MFTRSRFQPSDAEEAARVLAGLRERSLPLTSAPLRRRPRDLDTAIATRLLEEDRQTDRLGTFLLKRDGAVIALVHVDDRQDGGRAAVFSGLEIGPKDRRGGTFWRLLGGPLIRAFSSTASFDRLEAVTSNSSPREISSYRRFGFRALPQRSPPALMENYLPTIVRHPAARGFFARCDLLRSLETRRSHGCDHIPRGNLNLFAYRWSGGGDRLQVMVDWERRQIVSIARPDWAACCFTASEDPFKVHYWVRNRGKSSISFCVERKNGELGRSRLQNIPPAQAASGDIFVSAGADGPVTAVSVAIEIDGERVPFHPRRLKVRRGPDAPFTAPQPPSSTPRFPLSQSPSPSPPAAAGG